VRDTGWARDAILTVLRDGGPQRAKSIRLALPTHEIGDGRTAPFCASTLYVHLAWLRQRGLVERVAPAPRPLWRYVKGAPDDEQVPA